MSDTSPSPTVLPSKPLIASTTAQAVAAVYVSAVFAAWPIVLKLAHGQPLTQEEIVVAIGAIGTLLGGAGALYGRLKALHPIRGLLRTPGAAK